MLVLLGVTPTFILYALLRYNDITETAKQKKYEDEAQVAYLIQWNERHNKC